MIRDLLLSVAQRDDFDKLLARFESADTHTLSLGGRTLAAKGLVLALL